MYALRDADIIDATYIVDHNLSHISILEQVAIPEEQEISTLEGRLHTAGEDDDDRTRRIGDYGEAFPHLRAASLSAVVRP